MDKESKLPEANATPSLDDYKIVELFSQRDESALSQVKKKYNSYLYSIAYNILGSKEDSEECVNDTYKSAWDSIPPNKPQLLSAYLGRITRNLALNRYSYNNSEKRCKSFEVALSELEECLPESNGDISDEIAFKNAINKFLRSVSLKKRTIFILRYWHLCKIEEISQRLSMSQVNVKVTLLRLRDKLKRFLEKEGINL